jgi:hypothetical protein
MTRTHCTQGGAPSGCRKGCHVKQWSAPEEARCAHCQKPFVGGTSAHSSTIRILTGSFVHDRCAQEFVAHSKGLVHPCPQCRTTGKVHTGRHERVTKQGGIVTGQDPRSGIHYNERITWTEDVPVMAACELCRGQGYLEKAPMPITQQTGWRRA